MFFTVIQLGLKHNSPTIHMKGKTSLSRIKEPTLIKSFKLVSKYAAAA
jgi:hypothetical protein